jgi:hypothetical protein
MVAAAAVMVVVFASFAARDNHILKLFGLSLASAVFLDAVVIRSILLPAVLQLLGRATWAIPRRAGRRLPRLAIEESQPPRETRMTIPLKPPESKSGTQGSVVRVRLCPFGSDFCHSVRLACSAAHRGAPLGFRLWVPQPTT